MSDETCQVRVYATTWDMVGHALWAPGQANGKCGIHARADGVVLAKRRARGPSGPRKRRSWARRGRLCFLPGGAWRAVHRGLAPPSRRPQGSSRARRPTDGGRVTNKPKNKGAAAETAVLRYVQANGFPGRLPQDPFWGTRTAGYSAQP